MFIKVYTSIYHSGETPNREVKIGEEKAGLNSDIIIDSFIPIYPQWSMYIFILMPILFPIVMISFSWLYFEKFSALFSSFRSFNAEKAAFLKENRLTTLDHGDDKT